MQWRLYSACVPEMLTRHVSEKTFYTAAEAETVAVVAGAVYDLLVQMEKWQWNLSVDEGAKGWESRMLCACRRL